MRLSAPGTRGRAVTALAFVFALGVLAGIAIEHNRPARSRATLSATEEHEQAMVELREELGLDEEQIAQIHAILARRHDEVQKSWERLRPEVQSAMRQVHIEIAELLRPDQRERFHHWLMRRREKSGGSYLPIPQER